MNSAIRSTFRRAAAALLCCALSSSAVALAQISPSDRAGLGTKRGIQQMNESGQVGTVTLFGRAEQTLVDVAMHGAPAGKTESVAVHRNANCEGPIALPPAYVLQPLRNGQSRTLVNAPIAKLLSGNYSLVIASMQKAQHAFACGHLFR